MPTTIKVEIKEFSINISEDSHKNYSVNINKNQVNGIINKILGGWGSTNEGSVNHPVRFYLEDNFGNKIDSKNDVISMVDNGNVSYYNVFGNILNKRFDGTLFRKIRNSEGTCRSILCASFKESGRDLSSTHYSKEMADLFILNPGRVIDHEVINFVSREVLRLKDKPADNQFNYSKKSLEIILKSVKQALSFEDKNGSLYYERGFDFGGKLFETKRSCSDDISKSIREADMVLQNTPKISSKFKFSGGYLPVPDDDGKLFKDSIFTKFSVKNKIEFYAMNNHIRAKTFDSKGSQMFRFTLRKDKKFVLKIEILNQKTAKEIELLLNNKKTLVGVTNNGWGVATINQQPTP